jgi:hypothetical protein
MGYESSVAALFLISVERLFAISFPLQHLHKVTRGSCRVAIAISWTVVIIMNAIPFFWNDWQPQRPCSGINTFTDAYLKYLYNVYLYGLMGCTVLTNLVLCIMVTRASSKGPMFTTTTKSELKIVKMVLMHVSTVLFITWIPFNVLGNNLMDRLVQGKSVAFSLLVTFHMSRGITLLSIVADPVIYFSNNPQCQKAVVALFSSDAVQKQSVYSLSASKQKAKTSTSKTPDAELNGTKL